MANFSKFIKIAAAIATSSSFFPSSFNTSVLLKDLAYSGFCRYFLLLFAYTSCRDSLLNVFVPRPATLNDEKEAYKV